MDAQITENVLNKLSRSTFITVDGLMCNTFHPGSHPGQSSILYLPMIHMNPSSLA